MPKSRKDLIVEAIGITPIKKDEGQLKAHLAQGNSYLSLVQSYGWKRLLEEYIIPQMDVKRLYGAPKETRDDVIAGQMKLQDMLDFINDKVSKGQKAYEALKE